MRMSIREIRLVRWTLMLSLAFAMTGCAAAPATKEASAAPPRKLEIYFCDTEGGAGTLIVTPAGESVLVDTGNPGERDPGRIAAAAKLAGLDHIDTLVVTHYHVDHMG